MNLKSAPLPELADKHSRRRDYYYREPNHLTYICAERVIKKWKNATSLPDWYDYIGIPLDNYLNCMAKTGEHTFYIDNINPTTGEWEGMVRFYEPYILEDYEEYEYGGVREQILLIKPFDVNRNPDHLKGAFRSYLRRQCHCEYDCCGHYNGGARQVEKLKDGCWLVRTIFYQNV